MSDKMDKTVVVKIERTFKHPVYKKHVRSAVKCKAHDEDNECQLGDRVLIVETPSAAQGQALARGADHREAPSRPAR